jgi:hypothetical protein
MMSATKPIDADALRTQLAHVETAASKLIARLADRAAYARDEEFEEIRGLISALRKLGGQA